MSAQSRNPCVQVGTLKLWPGKRRLLLALALAFIGRAGNPGCNVARLRPGVVDSIELRTVERARALRRGCVTAEGEPALIGVQGIGKPLEYAPRRRVDHRRQEWVFHAPERVGETVTRQNCEGTGAAEMLAADSIEDAALALA